MNINRKVESRHLNSFLPDLLIGLSLAFLSLLIRWFYISSYLQNVPDALQPANDAKMYWDLGRKIYLEGWLLPDHRPFYQAPLYPYVLAMLHHLGIHSVTPIIYLNAVLGVFNCVLCYWIARRFVNRTCAGVAALGFSFSHLPLFFESKILPTTLGIFLFLLFIRFFIIWLDRTKYFYLFLSSILFGLLVICLPHFLFLFPCLWVFFFVRYPQLDFPSYVSRWKPQLARFKSLLSIRILPSGWIFLFGFILVLSPVALRNRLIGGDWTLICANPGVTLYMGTNDRAEGGLGPVEGLSNEIERQRTESIELASKLAGKPLNPAQASWFWTKKTAAWISTHPLRFLRLELKKFLWAFYWTPPAVNYSFHFENVWMPSFTILQVMTGILLIAALAGYSWIQSLKPLLERFLICLITGYVFLSSVYYASDRFLAAHIPVLAIMTGWVMQNLPKPLFRVLLDLFQRNPVRFWHRAVYLSIAIMLVINPFFSWKSKSEIGWGWYNLGVFYEHGDQPETAMQSYRTALKYIPNAPSLLINLGVLYAKQDNLDDSTRLFERALQLEPTNRTALQNLLINYRRQGREVEAENLQNRYRTRL